VDLVDNFLRKQRYQTAIEPSIRTEAGIRKPDIVAWIEGARDDWIVSDMENLDYCHNVSN